MCHITIPVLRWRNHSTKKFIDLFQVHTTGKEQLSPESTSHPGLARFCPGALFASVFLVQPSPTSTCLFSTCHTHWHINYRHLKSPWRNRAQLMGSTPRSLHLSLTTFPAGLCTDQKKMVSPPVCSFSNKLHSFCLSQVNPFWSLVWPKWVRSTFFFFYCSTGAWTQGLHLKPLHQPFTVKGFFQDMVLWNYLPRLTPNHDPPDLCLLSS
jgi:hypothetical protein